ncbi:MAG: disulfide oxidoreductase, partial [Pseudomonadota bacterium]
LFEPLIALQKDEALSGLAKGFAFQMVEGLGVLPRAAVADDVKALDQDARGLLRKNGLRFGQFTIFVPVLLKPAPTRLRLVLWSLSKGLDTFPEAPPPGLVTVPAMADGPQGVDTMAGYRNAGDRAIRIDMLERLADMLRAEDSRGGFEAKADMLSITGMTLDQFAALMEGLGYRAQKGEREKAKPVSDVVTEDAAPDAADVPVMDAAQAVVPTAETEAAPATDAMIDIPDAGQAPIVAEPAETPDVPADIPANSETEIDPGTAPDAAVAGPETEVFYTFTWGGNAGRKRGAASSKPRGQRAQDSGKPRGKGKPKGKGRGPQGSKPQNFSARPPKKEKAIDPDNPFAAALMGLKDGK